MAIDGLEGLKSEHGVFEFINRTGSAKTIMLLGGDTVQVQPGAKCRVASENFHQLPSFVDFEPVIPSTEKLIEAGLISTTAQTKPVGATTKTIATISTENQDGGTPISSKK